jgi:SAM-dependent methyltransferase
LADGSFDVVLSTFGVMFASNQEQAARELLRVCSSGGRIGLANWTPDSVIEQVLQIAGRYLPTAADVPSPALWGTRARLDELLAAGAREIRTERREFVFRYRSPMHWIEVFRTYYGPINMAFAALEPGAQAACTRELLDLIEEGNRSRDRSLVLPSEYLEVVVITR